MNKSNATVNSVDSAFIIGAINGGAYYSSNSNLSVSDCKHEYYNDNYYYCTDNGGVFYISNPISIHVDSCTFSDISCVTNGGVYYISASSYSYIKFRKMVYQNIYYVGNGGVLYGSGISIEFYNSIFYNIDS
jgi:hypothetical protein